jgi:hypothetical protein
LFFFKKRTKNISPAGLQFVEIELTQNSAKPTQAGLGGVRPRNPHLTSFSFLKKTLAVWGFNSLKME